MVVGKLRQAKTPWPTINQITLWREMLGIEYADHLDKAMLEGSLQEYRQIIATAVNANSDGKQVYCEFDDTISVIDSTVEDLKCCYCDRPGECVRS